ncbi:uncharacterized protein LOC125267802 [Megalobrama amblycephala]|uniref:uncharacterized protein LOC125267802 n=1 Tax=Megalobrama amblycephala TaxID=75352 RepID=UPI002013D560|nr:uncharacterized protein LOC125267802 [Megalobrama amblycephala]
MNACPMGDDFEVADPEDDIDTRVNKMKLLNETVLGNIERAQKQQQKSFQNRKRKFVKVCSVQAGDDVLISGDPKKRRTDTFKSRHQGPYNVASISSKGVATIVKGSSVQRVNVSRLRTYYRSKNRPAERKFLQDHCYTTATFKRQIEHPYACSGAKWEKDLGPIQDELLKYVLDKNRPSQELIVKEGKICLTREDFWSLGLNQCMESNIGNACLKIVEEAARRHGKNVHIVDLYVVPTWKDKDVDPVHCLPTHCSLHCPGILDGKNGKRPWVFSSTAFRDFLCCLHADVCSQYLYLVPINIH